MATGGDEATRDGDEARPTTTREGERAGASDDARGERADGTMMLKFLISPSAAGSVIGKGGATINEFQALTGARVQLSRNREVFPGTNDRVVSVSGDLRAILQVLHLIMSKFVADGEGIDRTGSPQLTLVVPNGSCGCVIGKGGAKIRSFVEDSRADIKLSNQDRMFPGCNDRTLTITGSLDCILRAVALVASTLAEDPSYMTLVQRQSTYSVQSPLAMQGSGGRRSGEYGRRVGGYREDETSILVTIPDALVVNVEKKGVTAEEVNAAFKEYQDGPMKGVLAITDTPLVSVDFRCTDVSTTIDAALTMVMGDDMVKVVAWYDNEWGYTQRVVDLSLIVANGLINDGVANADPMDQLCADDPSADECKVFE